MQTEFVVSIFLLNSFSWYIGETFCRGSQHRGQNRCPLFSSWENFDNYLLSARVQSEIPLPICYCKYKSWDLLTTWQNKNQ